MRKLCAQLKNSQDAPWGQTHEETTTEWIQRIGSGFGSLALVTVVAALGVQALQHYLDRQRRGSASSGQALSRDEYARRLAAMQAARLERFGGAKGAPEAAAAAPFDPELYAADPLEPPEDLTKTAAEATTTNEAALTEMKPATSKVAISTAVEGAKGDSASKSAVADPMGRPSMAGPTGKPTMADPIPAVAGSASKPSSAITGGRNTDVAELKDTDQLAGGEDAIFMRRADVASAAMKAAASFITETALDGGNMPGVHRQAISTLTCPSTYLFPRNFLLLGYLISMAIGSRRSWLSVKSSWRRLRPR